MSTSRRWVPSLFQPSLPEPAGVKGGAPSPRGAVNSSSRMLASPVVVPSAAPSTPTAASSTVESPRVDAGPLRSQRLSLEVLASTPQHNPTRAAALSSPAFSPGAPSPRAGLLFAEAGATPQSAPQSPSPEALEQRSAELAAALRAAGLHTQAGVVARGRTAAEASISASNSVVLSPQGLPGGVGRTPSLRGGSFLGAAAAKEGGATAAGGRTGSFLEPHVAAAADVDGFPPAASSACGAVAAAGKGGKGRDGLPPLSLNHSDPHPSSRASPSSAAHHAQQLATAFAAVAVEDLLPPVPHSSVLASPKQPPHSPGGAAHTPRSVAHAASQRFVLPPVPEDKQAAAAPAEAAEEAEEAEARSRKAHPVFFWLGAAIAAAALAAAGARLERGGRGGAGAAKGPQRGSAAQRAAERRELAASALLPVPAFFHPGLDVARAAVAA